MRGTERSPRSRKSVQYPFQPISGNSTHWSPSPPEFASRLPSPCSSRGSVSISGLDYSHFKQGPFSRTAERSDNRELDRFSLIGAGPGRSRRSSS